MRIPTALIFILHFCSGTLLCSPGFHPDSLYTCPGNKPSLFMFTAGYRLPVNKQTIINSGHGLYVEAGINSAYFFPGKQLQAGVFAGWAMTDKLWSTSFNQEFVNDYRNSINTEQNFSSPDSGLIHLSSELFTSKKGRSPVMPGCEMQSFHNYSLYYGILLKIPLRFTPVIKIYTGSTRSHYQGPGELLGEGDYTIIRLKRKMLGCELLVTDFVKQRSSQNYFKKAGIGFYYEYCNFSTAALHADDGSQSSGIALSRFTSSDFLKKYRHEQTFGIKVSFNIM